VILVEPGLESRCSVALNAEKSVKASFGRNILQRPGTFYLRRRTRRQVSPKLSYSFGDN